MADLNLVKQLQQQEPAGPKLEHASNLILIDNYDSFTYNVYQYLELEGATVTVYRNDKITLEQLVALNPTQLVVSPGPGHPSTDAGISIEAIKHFAGKIPILGVCMGQQCMISAFGGIVDVTGEILHGKTSPLSHDGQGVYKGLSEIPVELPVTRYHSLAGTHDSLPACLEVSSWIANEQGGKGIIMGVRHNEFVIEGVQFHPESILSADGRLMFRNFLRMRGGTWKENELQQKVRLSKSATANQASAPTARWRGQSILDTIFRARSEKVAGQKVIPSQRPEDLEEYYRLDLAPPLISFADRVRQSPYSLSLLAEVKRASPSKGEIAMHINAPAQARRYALAGASAISVLTEPDWFKGSIEDLRAVRAALAGMPNRPAVLRKEFVFDEYQILEARLAGADTVLLIVKMLDDALLRKLYDYSRSLGMEPLVEVNNTDEMQRALAIGSKVIGVNNRNLVNFEVDLDTTSRLMENIPSDIFVCALSGISGPEEVKPYRSQKIGGVLVGEALMRAPDVAAFIYDLLDGPSANGSQSLGDELLVKICGTRSAEAAKVAVESGADMVGMILVEGRSRYVSPEVAVQISAVVHGTQKPGKMMGNRRKGEPTGDFFSHGVSVLSNPHRTLLVGVFQNQALEHIIDCIQLYDLDVVQLHGSEPIELASLIPVPVIRRFGPGDAGLATRGFHVLPLIDSAAGGTGQLTSTSVLKARLESDATVRVILAGGLNPDNVAQTLSSYKSARSSIVAVDTSSGVETDGKQDLAKIKRFVTEAKSA